MGPREFIFFKGGNYYKHGKVELTGTYRRDDKDITYFLVNKKWEVRLEITRITETSYLKNWSCTCDIGGNMKHNNICSHMVAAIVFYSIMLAYKK